MKQLTEFVGRRARRQDHGRLGRVGHLRVGPVLPRRAGHAGRRRHRRGDEEHRRRAGARPAEGRRHRHHDAVPRPQGRHAEGAGGSAASGRGGERLAPANSCAAIGARGGRGRRRRSGGCAGSGRPAAGPARCERATSSAPPGRAAATAPSASRGAGACAPAAGTTSRTPASLRPSHLQLVSPDGQPRAGRLGIAPPLVERLAMVSCGARSITRVTTSIAGICGHERLALDGRPGTRRPAPRLASARHCPRTAVPSWRSRWRASRSSSRT